MAVNKGEIGIYGILRRDGGDNILAKTDLIQDDALLKTQELLNLEAVSGAALATAHIANTNNPHSVTKAQVGLDKVTNDEQVKRTEMGKPLGVATLDGLGKVPSSLLPAYVDDVVEYETVDSFPKYGESGKIYVETSTNLTYRWTGTQYIEISKSIGLGETESTAYPGDKGKLVADSLDSHIKDTTNPHNVTKELVGLGNVDNTADKDKPVSTALLLAISGVQDNLTSHIDDKLNPHGVTKAQVGLDKVDNTADSEKIVHSSEYLGEKITADNFLGKYKEGQPGYLVQLGFAPISGNYDSIVLCITNSFYDLQHLYSGILSCNFTGYPQVKYLARVLSLNSKDKATFYTKVEDKKVYFYYRVYNGTNMGTLSVKAIYDAKLLFNNVFLLEDLSEVSNLTEVPEEITSVPDTEVETMLNDLGI